MGTTRRARAVGRPGWRRAAARPGVLCLLLAVGCRADGPEPPEAPSEEAAPRSTDHAYEGVWSPDGLRLAVTWDQGVGARLYGLLAGTDSTPPEPGRGLPLSRGRAAWASWSPDGLWIAYESRGDLQRMRPDGTFAEPLSRHPAAESHPAYSPDGGRIAFVSEREGADRARLWLMEADGSDPRPVPLAVAGAWRAPAWHPGGEALVAEATSDAGTFVYRVMPSDGSARRLAEGSAPDVSASGDAVFYSRNDSIFRLPWGEREAGSEPGPMGGARVGRTGGETLVHAPGHTPRAAPDGVRLAFVRGNHPRAALYLLNLESGAVRRLTDEPPARPEGRPGAN